MSAQAYQPPKCSHCGEFMTRMENPPYAIGDGLGWGSSYLWVCDNDKCPMFVKGFEHTMNNYGRASSLRVCVEPDTGMECVIPAASFSPETLRKFSEIRNKYLDKARKENILVAYGDAEDIDQLDLEPGGGFIG